MVEKVSSRIDAEQIPKKKQKKRPSLWVQIVIFDDGKPIRRHKTDYSNRSNRAWLEKLVIWAVNNDKTVEFTSYEA